MLPGRWGEDVKGWSLQPATGKTQGALAAINHHDQPPSGQSCSKLASWDSVLGTAATRGAEIPIPGGAPYECSPLTFFELQFLHVYSEDTIDYLV